MKTSLKPWRESASLMLVAKSVFSPSSAFADFNYKLLTVKRSSKSSILPNTNVFPGGNICRADKSRDWLGLYERFGFKSNSFEKLNYCNNRPDILQDANSNDVLPQFLSLRICAIRETFEECGILICRSYKINYEERIARWASFIDIVDIKKWQSLVHNQAEHFLDMCATFEIYPDVWALKDWSNWVTPASISQRFDTIFFLASFHHVPAAHADRQEVQHLEWATPRDYILRNHRHEVALPSPQFYEISRLGNFEDVDSLAKFSTERATAGLERFFPVRYSTDKGIVVILPGDDLHPKHPETADDVIKVDSLPESERQHRLGHKVYNNRICIKNYKPKFQHVAPIDLLTTKL